MCPLIRRACLAVIVTTTALVVPDARAQPSPQADARIDVQDQTGGDPLAKTLERLREHSTEPVQLRGRGGRLASASFDIALPTVTGDAAEDALGFLEAHALALQIPEPAKTLVLARVVRSDEGASVYFDQHFGGVGVTGGQIVVYLAKETAKGLTGAWLTEAPPRDKPGFDAARAAERALEDAGSGFQIVGSPRLVYYDRSLLVAPAGKEARTEPATVRAAWRVSAQGGSNGGWYYLIDAQTGAILERAPAASDALDYEIGSAGGGNLVIPCWVKRPPGTIFSADATPWFRESGQVAGVTPDAEGRRAEGALRATYAALARLGRDGWDDRGGFIYGGLDVVFRMANGGVNVNAQYEPFCNQVTFSDNMATTDVVAHEMGHGVVRFSADFMAFPANAQPRSLNEHYADVIASLVDTANWTIGEGSALNTIRNMANPVMVGNQPDRMSLFNSTTPFPHPNSNIMSKAAFLIADGQTFNGLTVNGIGREKMGRLYYATLTTRLANNADFQTAADQTLALARQWATSTRFGFSVDDACSVARAFSAIELDGDLDCDGLRDSADGSPDRDLDGFADGVDNCPGDSNPGQLDSDRDGQGDVCDPDVDNDGSPNASDNCPTVANPSQADFNRDGAGDACADADGDRVLDVSDNCQLVANADQRNGDRDASGDACDADDDNDAVPDGTDNCPLLANASQSDADGDGRGDDCDRCPTTADSGRDTDRDGSDDACDADDDNDGVADGSDNCPLISNSNQLDVDGNGLGQACDPDEQARLSTGGSPMAYEAVFKRRLQRFDRFSIPLGCAAGEIDPGFGGRDEVVDLEFKSSVPVEVAVVNRFGERLAFARNSLSGALRFPIGRDLCPLLGYDVDDRIAIAGAQRYSVEVTPLKASRGATFTMSAAINPYIRDPRVDGGLR
jgi:Zn-dependent metalloprotease